MSSDSAKPAMDCRELFSLLSEYLDEELPPEACEQIRDHIQGCAPCVEFVNSLKRSIELVHGFQAGEHPAPLPPPARDELKAAYRKMLLARGAARP